MWKEMDYLVHQLQRVNSYSHNNLRHLYQVLDHFLLESCETQVRELGILSIDDEDKMNRYT